MASPCNIGRTTLEYRSDTPILQGVTPNTTPFYFNAGSMAAKPNEDIPQLLNDSLRNFWVIQSTVKEFDIGCLKFFG